MMRILRWFGMVLMGLAVVAGSATYFKQSMTVDVRRPFYAQGGGVTNHDDGARVYLIVSVLFFIAGLAAFLLSKIPISIARGQATRQKTEKHGPEWTRDTASAAQDLYARYRKQQRK